MAGRKTAKAPTFEEGLAKLEAMAGQMEHGELPLDELLKLYEEGMKLSAELTQRLDAMEGRMREIQAGGDGKPVAVPTDVARQESLLED